MIYKKNKKWGNTKFIKTFESFNDPTFESLNDATLVRLDSKEYGGDGRLYDEDGKNHLPEFQYDKCIHISHKESRTGNEDDKINDWLKNKNILTIRCVGVLPWPGSPSGYKFPKRKDTDEQENFIY